MKNLNLKKKMEFYYNIMKKNFISSLDYSLKSIKKIKKYRKKYISYLSKQNILNISKQSLIKSHGNIKDIDEEKNNDKNNINELINVKEKHELIDVVKSKNYEENNNDINNNDEFSNDLDNIKDFSLNKVATKNESN